MQIQKILIFKIIVLLFFITSVFIFVTFALDNVISSSECSQFKNLKDLDTLDPKERTYFSDKNLKSFVFENYIFCIGKVENSSSGPNISHYVIYSRSLYVSLAQIFPVLYIFILKNKFKKINLIIFTIFYQFIIQVYFNLNTGFNYINNVSIFTPLILILFLYYYED